MDEKTRSKMVVISDGWQKSDVQLQRYIPAGDLNAVLAHNDGGHEENTCRLGKESQKEHAATGGDMETAPPAIPSRACPSDGIKREQA